MIKKSAQRHSPKPIPIDWYHFLTPSFSSDTTFEALNKYDWFDLDGKLKMKKSEHELRTHIP